MRLEFSPGISGKLAVDKRSELSLLVSRRI
jgi:hypothetical protein